MKKKPGFTLMELMLVVTIMGIVMLAAPKLFTSVYRFVRLAIAKGEIQRSARGALANINMDIRQAQASSVVVDCLAGQPPQSRLTFTKYDVNGSTQSVSYYQQGSQLFMRLGASGGRMIAGDLRYLAFTYPHTDDPAIISISLTFERATYEGGSKALQMAVEKVRIMN